MGKDKSKDQKLSKGAKAAAAGSGYVIADAVRAIVKLLGKG